MLVRTAQAVCELGWAELSDATFELTQCNRTMPPVAHPTSRLIRQQHIYTVYKISTTPLHKSRPALFFIAQHTTGKIWEETPYSIRRTTRTKSQLRRGLHHKKRA